MIGAEAGGITTQFNYIALFFLTPDDIGQGTGHDK